MYQTVVVTLTVQTFKTCILDRSYDKLFTISEIFAYGLVLPVQIVQSILVISKFEGLSEILRDIRTSRDTTHLQNWGKINRTTTFHKYGI